MTAPRNDRALLRLLPVAAGILVLSAFLLGVQGAAPPPPPEPEPGRPRADIIRIDGLRRFGKLERPAVTYLHEKHTRALAPRNLDCLACHLPAEKALSTKFKRLEDVSREQTMAVYHTHCTGCHRETAARGEPSGPVSCAGCHQERPVASSWRDIGMDRSLHYRHVKAQENRCEVCHHERDPATQKLVYVKGNENNCRSCHREEPVEKVRTLRQAAHEQCIDCHRKRIARKEESGPIYCSGCHDPAFQAKVEKVKEVPRLLRGQPDQTLVKAARRGAPPIDPAERVAVVAFNHIGHEAYVDTCRACHHATMASCASCHPLEGAKEGKFVTLQTAMHRGTAEASCIGCHNAVKAKPACAGCHAAIPVKDPPDVAGCASCHVPRPEGLEKGADRQAVARRLLEARSPVRATYADEEIPENVEIKVLSRTYEGAKLPHRRIVKALAKGAAESRLAAAFHRDPGTLCQGCHHHSPVAKKPPACASCHAQPFDPRHPGRPGLQAAYHLQCMECHRHMGIEKPVATDCTGCHKEKR